MSRYKVKRGVSGLGLFAVTAFRKGERVIEYVGELIDDDKKIWIWLDDAI